MKITGRVALAALSAALCLGGGSLVAQDRPGRGNFDPEQFRQRMMERYREQLEVKSDDEWKLISERIEKVSDARREANFGGGGPGGFGGPGGPGGRGGRRANPDGALPTADGAKPAEGTSPSPDAAPPRPPRGFGGETGPEREALQQAFDSKAVADDLKAKLAKLREARKAKEAKLEKAQDELRQVLTVRQEAAAVLAGLLK